MPARVKVNMGYTVAMGDFEFIRIDFGIEDDVRPDEKSGQCFDRLYEWTEKRLSQEVDKARKVARGR